jgi:hypothetical protein
LRLSNQVVEEVQKHFNDMVFDTIIQRNVKLSEAPSFGESIINYDATSKGAANYLHLAQEVIKKNSFYGKGNKKTSARKRVIRIIKRSENDIKSVNDKNADKVVGNIIELEIEAIEINPFQPEVILMRIIKRTCYSIKELGVIQPITVRKLDFNKYQLISGERRLRASSTL